MPFPIWILLALASHALNAAAQIADRFLLTRRVPDPISYAFFIGIYTGAGLLLAPFFLFWPGIQFVVTALLAGSLFLVALLPFFSALKAFDASRAIPATGATVAVGTLVLATFFAAEQLTLFALIAFVFLVAGQVTLALQKSTSPQGHFLYFLSNVLLAGLLFSAAAVLRKIVYTSFPLSIPSFVNASLWIGMGMTLAAVLLLIIPSFRKRILVSQPAIRRPQNIALFLTKQTTSGASGILLNLAIALGPVSLVQAMQGAQYIFLLGLVIVLSHRFPYILREELGGKILIQKLAAIILIIVGLALLALQ